MSNQPSPPCSTRTLASVPTADFHEVEVEDGEGDRSTEGRLFK